MPHPLWNHQAKSIQAILDHIRGGTRRILLTSPTGGGKSRIIYELMAYFLAEHRWRSIVYTNRKMLVEQIVKGIGDAGLDCGIRAAGNPERPDAMIQVGSIQTEDSRVYKRKGFLKWELFPANVVFVDECFVGDTEVLTPLGPTRIDSVRPGDKVYTGAGIGDVVATSCRPTKDLYTVRLNDGSQFTCTGNHRIFTGNGWREAWSLEYGAVVYRPEDVRLLWETVGSEAGRPEWQVIRPARTLLQCADVLLSILRKEVEESDGQERIGSENAADTPGYKTQADQARRKRAIAALSAVGDPSRTWRGLGIGGADSNGQGPGQRVADVLQGGHRKRSHEDRHRTGWWEPFGGSEVVAGCEERGTAGGTRVVSVSRDQRAGVTPVYNLHVGGHPSYFAGGVLAHNCHIQSGKVDGSMMQRVKEDHFKSGAIIIEVTATPLDLDGKAEVMVVAGNNSELRECGALVPAMHYGPDEPDLRHIGLTELTQTGDMSEPQIKKVMGAVDKDKKANPKLKKLFGRVLEWFNILNPDRRPSILFAPGVAESRWFAEEFCENGVAAAHIDGEDIWTQQTGDVTANRASRDELLEMSKDGTIKVLCNRFVLREGIDCPWLSHGVFATAFGSLQSYLQSGGRLLRAYPGMERVTIQDHGGNWWRHGSLNSDREWSLGLTSRLAKGIREDGLREKKINEPMRCPRCAAIMLSVRCVCGFVLNPKAKSRPVVQENGELVLMRGDIFKPRKTEMRDDTAALYAKCFYRMKHGNKTFQQAIGLFYQENGYFPPTNLPWMPKNPEDLRRKIAEVPLENIIKPEKR